MKTTSVVRASVGALLVVGLVAAAAAWLVRPASAGGAHPSCTATTPPGLNAEAGRWPKPTCTTTATTSPPVTATQPPETTTTPPETTQPPVTSEPPATDPPASSTAAPPSSPPADEPPADELPVTGPGSVTLLTVAGLALALAGAAFVVVPRLRRRRSSEA